MKIKKNLQSDGNIRIKFLRKTFEVGIDFEFLKQKSFKGKLF